MMKEKLYTIGHSNHTINKFIDLLKMHSITAVCDVRSVPYSQANPHFNSNELQQILAEQNIAYVFLGEELGARSSNPDCYRDGKVQYELLAKEPTFLKGIERLHKGIHEYQVALMCAEKDPITCHRTILICRNIKMSNLIIQHILEDGSIESNEQSEKRLIKLLNIDQQDMFESGHEPIERAYDIQAQKIAFTRQDDVKQNNRKGISYVQH